MRLALIDSAIAKDRGFVVVIEKASWSALGIDEDGDPDKDGDSGVDEDSYCAFAILVMVD
eukprot:m.100793 g.100793  ORF g.100793 m.100793 type:complete len:60 (-) comp27274_c1_seq1:22-201(-)